MLATKDYKSFKVLDPDTNECLAEWIGASAANRCLPEDSVRPLADGCELVARAPKKPLVGVLQLTSKYMYGMTGHGVPLYLCVPMNRAYPGFRVACKERDRSQNLIVTFQFESWDSRSELPRGGLLQILGPVEDFATEANALAHLSCPWNAPRPECVPSVVPDSRKLLSTGTFNIDPPGCVDIDDVITIETLEGHDHYRVWITIADVAESVQPTSKEYQIAQKIGATSYQDGRAVRPMLHRDLSEKALSLLPGELRYGLALQLDISLGSPPTVLGFQKVLVQNQRQFTYESVLGADSTISRVLTALSGSEDSHLWIEACMVLYNIEAAKILKQASAGLLRAHDAPLQSRLAELQALQVNLPFLAYQSAKYVPATEESFHWGLGQALYCHASSPLRRFADLVNQKIIKEFLDGAMGHFTPSNLAHSLNRRGKQIQEAERNFYILQAIERAEKPEVSGIYLWTEESGKATFYCEAWKTTLRFKLQTEFPLEKGTSYLIQYFCDRRKANWKERILYSLSPISQSS